MSTNVAHTDVRPTCPMCLGLFNVPRQLPCSHSFCQGCLQSYITSKASEHEKNGYILCPICEQSTGYFKQNKSTSDWASLFPVDTVLQTLLPKESKVDRLCGSCNAEGLSVRATGFCIECNEAMCDNCLRPHRQQKMTKSHEIFTSDESLNNLQYVMKFAEGFTCFVHENEKLTFYCYNHKIACCDTCYFDSHESCSNLRKLKEELPALLRENEMNEIIEELKQLESQLKTLIDKKESNINDLVSQVNGLAVQIKGMRKKVNTALDELEKKVEMEGKRIHEEVVLRTRAENHQCLSLLHAIRNSQLLCETVYKHGINIQKFLTAEKIKLPLSLYSSQVREKCEKTDTLTLHLNFTPLLESILSLLSSDVESFMTMKESPLSMPGLRTRTKVRHVEKSEAFQVNISGSKPLLAALAILHRDRLSPLLVLVDAKNGQCILLNNSHQVVTTYKLTGEPYDICVLGDEEVAVSVRYQTKIQILSVRDDVISTVRTITTKYKCSGITACGKGELLVIGDCGKNKYCWSRIRDGTEISYSDQFDSTSGNIKYIAINNSRKRVYVTVHNKNALHCFNMEGKMQYTYSPDNLKCPLGVAVDLDDNIYVVGHDSNNIHQLSPEGNTIQVITKGLPHNPWAICFDNGRDTFFITSDSDHQNIYMYHLK